MGTETQSPEVKRETRKLGELEKLGGLAVFMDALVKALKEFNSGMPFKDYV
jgi:hypothetical protein